jgi:hypothetical protein
MRSVAIVGFSPITFPFIKDAQVDEYWTMNHAFFVKDMPRIDRLFEIHKRKWYLRGEQTKSRQYGRWLRKKHPFPIYMQENELTSKVPSGVRYPMEEVCEELLGGLIKKVGLEEIRLRYFTSSAAFMIALAIYERFDRIELYGIDMDSDTEWGYQRPNGEFWLGIALGRGIQVVLPEPSNLCSAKVYGYDVVPYIDKLEVMAIIDSYQNIRKEYKAQMDIASENLTKAVDDDDCIAKYLETSAWVYMYDGAITASARIVQEKDSYVSRQYIELHKVNYLNGLEYWKAMVNTIKGKIESVGRENIPDEDWKIYLNARASMYANLGAIQLHDRLMSIIDFRNPKMELKMEIIEEG